MISSDDKVFLQVLIRRGGSSAIPTDGPSKEIQALVDQGMCTVDVDPASGKKNVAITAQGRTALAPH